jgi:hypothetical protein
MEATYGIVWKHGDTAATAGSLEFRSEGLRLASRERTEDVPYAELESVRVGRSNGERLDGRPAVLLERTGGERLTIATVGQSALVREIADRVAALQHEAQADTRDDDASNVFYLPTPGPGNSDGGEIY